MSFAAQANKPVVAKKLSAKQRQERLTHAKELLGKHYKKSSVRAGENITKINGLVYKQVRERLPSEYQILYKMVAQTVIDESYKYKFDPVFLMSVIEGESSWRPEIVGGVGELGLMQIRPSTAEWIAGKFGLEYNGKDSLLDPVINIQIGAAFLSYLRDHFDDHAQLYLAAYNMGQKNVASALSRNKWPKEYPAHVMKFYVGFYETLGEKLQDQRTPTSSASNESDAAETTNTTSTSNTIKAIVPLS